MDKLLEIVNLKTHFYTPNGIVPAVDDVSFHVNRGETFCIVGESGCGKSATIMSIVKLVPSPPGKYIGGKVLFEDKNLLEFSKKEIVKIRGKEISMIFQEPMTALNPVHTIGKQISEILITHEKNTKRQALERSEELLTTVGVPDAGRVVKCFPHELSGGMRQRAMIAIALACKPKLLLADEPTTALDVTIQAQILDLIRELKKTIDMTVMLITHDLGVVAEMADRVAVMYCGKIVEQGNVEDIFREPLHPYTEGLINCIPRVDKKLDLLHVVKGQVPNPLNFPKGCRFHPRCPYSKDICLEKYSKNINIGKRVVNCHFYPWERTLNKENL